MADHRNRGRFCGKVSVTPFLLPGISTIVCLAMLYALSCCKTSDVLSHAPLADAKAEYAAWVELTR